MKLKPEHHLLITLVAYVIIIYHYIYSYEIITHPYMFFLLIGLFCLGGWHLVIGIRKFKERK
jgi:hypothetical protein